MYKIQAYTDGACSGNPGPMGAGAILICNGKIRQISTPLGHGTNSVAELQAVSLALTAVKEDARADAHITVYSDSQYAVGVLGPKKWKARVNTQLVLAIRELITQFAKVDFVQVAAHTGDKYNEWADNLARNAVRGNKINCYA